MPIDILSPEERQRIEAQRAADLAAGQARIGGIFSTPLFLDAYRDAAAALIANARATDRFADLGIPCMYLQRHAMELNLKYLISSLYDIYFTEEELAAHRKQPVPTFGPSKGEKENLTSCHKLGVLHDQLLRAIERHEKEGYDFGPLPADLKPLIDEIEKIERSEVTRLRYDRLKTGKMSFPKRDVLLPLADIQRRLEAVITETGETFAKEIDHEAQALNHTWWDEIGSDPERQKEPLKPEDFDFDF